MYRPIAIALLLSFGICAAPAAEKAGSCAAIVDDALRLNCYDGAALPAADTPASGFWRRRMEADAARDTFTLTQLKPNYITYSYLSNPNEEEYEFLGEDDELENSEIKFQLSFRTKLADDLLESEADLWFGYTQVSYWQLFNSDISSPFRETNYLPEFFVSFLTDYELFGLRGSTVNVGVVHQSNGRSQPQSRSWDRVYSEFVFELDDFALSFKPWVRIGESEKDDDNPDIEDYLGNYEIRALYRREEQLFSVMGRNLFDDEHRYNAELQWSFPIQNRLRGLVQWYNGYGENMIDHDHKNNRISIGILMTDWL